ncbi:MAG: hypothetical protein QM534_07285 [Sediminibacterium sp.]|nr:hypothetical protein [Sediminibacterium sp.]
MKTGKISIRLAIAALSLSLLAVSCRKKEKEDNEPLDNEQVTASDQNDAEQNANDIDNIGSQAIETYTNNFMYGREMSGNLTGGATITLGAQTCTVDFGTTGVIGNDGKTRTGKLFYDWSASTNGATKYRHPGFKYTVTSSNYVVDGNQVNVINKTVENITAVSNGTFNPATTNLKWSVNANISMVKSGATITWNCSRTKELINTSDPNVYSGTTNPIAWSLAKIKLNGNSSGVNKKGESYTAVATDLVRDYTCQTGGRHRFVSGILEYTPGTRRTRRIDFGNGACDNIATVTIVGTNISFTIGQ